MRTLLAAIVAAGLAFWPATATPVAAAPPPDPANAWPSPPGANNWSCRPSAAHPNPVVLVHGLYTERVQNWFYLAPQLASHGYCVFAPDYGRNPAAPFPVNLLGGMAPMEQSAVELGAFIDSVLAATGAHKVDIVGHSEGSLMPNYYIKFDGGAAKVDHYVGIAPLWRGSNVLNLATLWATAERSEYDNALIHTADKLCGSCHEFLTGSTFIQRMNSGAVAVPGVTYTMLLTRNDQAVTPYTSGFLASATNIVVQDQCPNDISEHVLMAYDPIVATDVLNALAPHHPEPVRC